MATTAALRLTPITSSVGVVIEGIDLREPVAPDDLAQIRTALFDKGAVFFPGQDVDDEQLVAFVANFAQPIPEPFITANRENAPAVGTGNLEPHKYSTSVWHTDTSFIAEPPSFTALRAVSPPPYGGDTCWSSMYAAYDALSAPLQALFDGLSAVFSMEPVLRRADSSKAGDNAAINGASHVHPLVRVHPETGRKAIYFDEGTVTQIVGLRQYESEHLIALLREHVKSPDFAMRWHWRPNDLALWDNRCVQHYAVPDYSTPRVMQRLVTAGERPEGPRIPRHDPL